MKSTPQGTTWFKRARLAVAGLALAGAAVFGGAVATTPDVPETDDTAATWTMFWGGGGKGGPGATTNATWT